MRINELKLYSSNLNAQVDFYTKVLEIECIAQSKERASFQLGSSVLTFEKRAIATPYHFAINIPSNKENEALGWLKKRVSILRENQTELHDFDTWNAKAMYFYDADKNIVELISRKNLLNEQTDPFDQKQFLSISEIGLPTVNIEAKFNQLRALTGIQTYIGGFDRLLAIGDEMGLFICINKEVKDWFPTGDKAHSSDFELNFTEGDNAYFIRFENDLIHEINRP